MTKKINDGFVTQYPRKTGWYQWTPTDDKGPYNRDGKREIVGMVFRSPKSNGGDWCFFGTHIYTESDGRRWGNHFSMSLKSFIGHGDFVPVQFEPKGWHEMQWANAILMQEAPAMLEALESVIAESAVVSTNSKYDTIQISRGVLDDIRELIAKAKGEA